MEEHTKKTIAKVCFAFMIVMIVLIVPTIVGYFMYSSYLSKDNKSIDLGIVISPVLFFIVGSIVLGGIAHILVDKDDTKWEKAVYIMTFPSYIGSFLGIMIIKAVINFFNNSSESSVRTSQLDKSRDNEIIITYNGYQKKLYKIGLSTYYGKDGCIDSHNPYYGRSYIRYGEVSNSGAGPCWMSFDNGKTFVREDEFDPYTYNK